MSFLSCSRSEARTSDREAPACDLAPPPCEFSGECPYNKGQSLTVGLRCFAARIPSRFSQRGGRLSGSFIKEGMNMPIGTVKFFDNAKGYGFITNEAGGSDAFVHVTAVEAAGMHTLEKEQRVSYELENDKRGKSSAVNLQAA
jgi:CspA family cold shock protein